MNVENILKVADAIEQHSIPDLGFNMGGFVSTSRPDLSNHGCGTTACIAGWTVAVICGQTLLPRWQGDIEHDAIEALSIDEDVADALFFPSNEEQNLDVRKTPTDAVRTLRHLAATGEVNWDLPEPIPA